MRLNNWTAILVFIGALIYFLRVKGPQEYLQIDEDGRITVVPPPSSSSEPPSAEDSDEAGEETDAEPERVMNTGGGA